MSYVNGMATDVRVELLLHARGDALGFYRIASPILNRMVRRNIRKDLELLRTKLAG